MKKLILAQIFLCPILLMSCTKTSIQKTDLQEDNLKGRIVFLTEYSYKAVEDSGKIEKGKRLRETGSFNNDKHVSYNDDGNMVYSSYYYSHGALKDSIRYKYSKNGLLRKTIQYNSRGKRVYLNTYSYKEQNSELIVNLKGKSRHKDFSDHTETYKYDSLGNRIQLSSAFVYEYDENGNILVEKNQNQDGEVMSATYYKYDQQGRLLSTKSTQARWLLSEGQSFERKYDERMNIVEMKVFKYSGELERIDHFTYEYDDIGNWVKQIRFIDSRPKFIIERHIEYLPVSFTKE